MSGISKTSSSTKRRMTTVYDRPTLTKDPLSKKAIPTMAYNPQNQKSISRRVDHVQTGQGQEQIRSGSFLPILATAILMNDLSSGFKADKIKKDTRVKQVGYQFDL